MIYNRSGELIRSLVDEQAEAGKYETSWDGRNARGDVVASGTYIIVVQTEEYTVRDKILVVK